MSKLREMREKRANLWEQMKALRDAAEGRDFTAEENQSWDQLDGEIEALTRQIDRDEKLSERERQVGDVDPIPDPDTRKDDGDAQKRAADIFARYLRAGERGISAEEFRALESTRPELGGYLVAPQTFVTQLLQAVDAEVFVRQWATKYQVATNKSLGVPSLDADPDDGDWTAELATGNEDSAMAFGKRELVPHPLAKRVKLSNKLLRQAAIDPEALVRARLAQKFAVTQEKGFFTGSGVNQPLGFFTASAHGISTGRDVVCGTTTAITADGLIDLKYGLKSQYWPRAKWVFHRDAVKQIRKLKDQQDQYLWQPGLQAGQPDSILDTPFVVSEFAPNTFTTGQYTAIIGDFSFYWIADALDMTVQRLVELYAEKNQTGFIGRLETDGMPVLEEAFIRGKLA